MNGMGHTAAGASAATVVRSTVGPRNQFGFKWSVHAATMLSPMGPVLGKATPHQNTANVHHWHGQVGSVVFTAQRQNVVTAEQNNAPRHHRWYYANAKVSLWS